MSRHNRAARPRPQAAAAETSSLRIIGGLWRSQKLPFPEIEGLRPTPDRVRETLFNWLQTLTPGAQCLDLFCGSGALGFEALSRGAASATFVDASPEVIAQIRRNLQRLKAQNGEAHCRSALDWLEEKMADQEATYDLVFLDPPFHKDLIRPIATLLESRGLLSNAAMIYIETERDWTPQGLPDNWNLYREKQAGQVAYRLYQREDLGLEMTDLSPLPSL